MRKRHPKMKKSNLVFLSICVSFCFNSSVAAQNAAVVNGKPIPLAKLTRMLEKSGQMNSPDVKEKARDVLITKELILQEADKRGLTKNEEVRDAMEQARLSVLVSAVFEDYISKDEVHGQVAGIKRELIAAELKTLFTRRRFYSRIKWRSFQEMRLWLRGFPTPGKLMSEYVPLYAWA